MSRIVLTGAGGRLGSHLREPLAAFASDGLVSSDIGDGIGRCYPGESYVQADITDLDAMLALLDGADTVLHFGAFVDEGPFEKLLGPNFIGSYNVWEAAWRKGVKRVVYASSIHAVGMHATRAGVGTDAVHRPDTFYGLAKCFSEDLARMYWEKRGVEAVCLRIASCAPVVGPRALGTWLSTDDLVQLVTRAVDTPVVGFTVVYGVSDNDRSPFDNSGARFLGYRPKDNAEQFAEKILGEARAEQAAEGGEVPDPNAPGEALIGGPFAAVKLGESGLASMTIIDDTRRT